MAMSVAVAGADSVHQVPDIGVKTGGRQGCSSPVCLRVPKMQTNVFCS